MTGEVVGAGGFPPSGAKAKARQEWITQFGGGMKPPQGDKTETTAGLP